MTPAQLLSIVKKGTPPPAILLLGQEAYQRRRIKDAMLAAFPEGAVAQHDLTEIGLAETIDDARALSLFASERLIWVVNGEAALPRGRAAAADDEVADSDAPANASAGDVAPLASYVSDPTPGVTLVIEAIRF